MKIIDDDCISRQAVLEAFRNLDIELRPSAKNIITAMIKIIPSVTPQQKMGRWIESKGFDDRDHFYTCSECGRSINLICGAKLADYPYCHCGAKMEEVK